MNRAALELFGLKERQVSRWLIQVTQSARRAVARLWRTAITEGQLIGLDVPVMRPSGSELLRVEAHPVRDHAGALRGWVGSIRPADRGHEALDGSDHAVPLPTSVPVLLFDVDEHSRFTSFYGRVIGRLIAQPERFIGQHLSTLFSASTTDRLVAAALRSRQQQNIEVVRVVLKTPGGSAELVTRVSSLNDGRWTGLVHEVSGGSGRVEQLAGSGTDLA